MIFLFINDKQEILEIFASLFVGDQCVKFAECHSVEDGLDAIRENQPDVVLLDHNLSPDGGEGLEIVDRLLASGIVFYSTTDNLWTRLEYAKRDVRIIDTTKTKNILDVIARHSRAA